MPSDFSVYFTSRLMPGADTLRSLAAPPMVPVTMTARMTSTWRSVIMSELRYAAPAPYRISGGRHSPILAKMQPPLKGRGDGAQRQHRRRDGQRIGQAAHGL